MAQVIDELQGRPKKPDWRIILDGESPLSEVIISTVIPRDFRFSVIKYFGKSDLLVHVKRFNDITGVQGLTQYQRCVPINSKWTCTRVVSEIAPRQCRDF